MNRWLQNLEIFPKLRKLSLNGKIVCFSGAGMSAESNLSTFRDAGGLWEKNRIEDVATRGAWQRDPQKVLNFYNQRRKQLFSVKPNAAHLALAQLENLIDLQIITQNVDDLHERAGSSNVMHLHGELMKAQSDLDAGYVIELDHRPLQIGDKCPRGGQLRPHVVWFGEPVEKMGAAYRVAAKADLLLIIGTSLEVYPAAGLVTSANSQVIKLIIDPSKFNLARVSNVHHLKTTATDGMEQLLKVILDI
jgi:NAD-dependent deacetylase